MVLRALVVDDSKVMRTMVKNSLDKTGLAKFKFTEAQDGADALQKFDPKNIDICFVDWNMPKMNGFDFALEVRGIRGTRHIPIVFITSEKTMGKMMDATDKAGANAFICKPFTVDELKHKLKPILDKM